VRPRPVLVFILALVAATALTVPTAVATEDSTAVATEDGRPHYVRPGAPGQPSVRIDPASIAIPPISALAEAEVHFLNHMIPHHGQALMMSELAPDRVENERLRILAHQILQAQDAEIDQMADILRRHGHPVPDPRDHEGHHGMPGMLSPEQLAELEAADGQEFDELFLEFMIFHHFGALTVVEQLEDATGRVLDANVSALAWHIADSHWTEIKRMRVLLEDIRAGAT
jgi:uncharacterized protein (DUF305 family)